MEDRFNRIPIIKLWGQLLVPLQGELSDSEAATLTQEVLQTIRSSEARGLVIDISGVWMMDSHLCAVLSRLAKSARLMGVKAVLSGMSPSIAMTLQTMGISLVDVETTGSLEEALELIGITAIDRFSAQNSNETDSFVSAMLAQDERKPRRSE